MKTGIHPDYKLATVSCACGNTFQTRTTVGDLKLEICGQCHPFFSGKQKLVDTAGRVEKYLRKFKAARPGQTTSAVHTPHADNAGAK